MYLKHESMSKPVLPLSTLIHYLNYTTLIPTFKLPKVICYFNSNKVIEVKSREKMHRGKKLRLRCLLLLNSVFLSYSTKASVCVWWIHFESMSHILTHWSIYYYLFSLLLTQRANSVLTASSKSVHFKPRCGKSFTLKFTVTVMTVLTYCTWFLTVQ